MFTRVGFIAKALQQFSASVQLQQTRNTFIVKRRFPPGLRKPGYKPRPLKQRQYLYDLVKNTNIERRPDTKLVLLEFVEGVGFKGDIVSVRPDFAKFNLLFPKLAVYASPENIEKYAAVKDPDSAKNDLSLSAAMTARFLSRAIVAVSMNMDNPWTVEKFHVRAALRKAGLFVPDHAIELPDKPITGPNMDIEGKMFLVTVTVNGIEKAIVRCRIHHWTSDITRIAHFPRTLNVSPIFPEDEEIIKNLPIPPQFKKRETTSQ